MEKKILEEGWRVLFPKPKKTNTSIDSDSDDDKKKKEEEERILPAFQKDESGPHVPVFIRKNNFSS